MQGTVALEIGAVHHLVTGDEESVVANHNKGRRAQFLVADKGSTLAVANRQSRKRLGVENESRGATVGRCSTALSCY